MLAAYLSDGRKCCFCPLTSCSVQKKRWGRSVHETSVPRQTCAAMCIYHMCPLCSIFSSNLSWSLQEKTLSCQGCTHHRLRTPVTEESRAQRIRCAMGLHFLSCVGLCSTFQLDFLAVGPLPIWTAKSATIWASFFKITFSQCAALHIWG